MPNMDSVSPLLQSPPQWSLEIGYLGRGFVFAAIVLFLASALGWLFVSRKESFKKYASWSFTAGCLSLFGAFASLASLFVMNRLEFSYVSEHGDSTNTIPYRIAGIWAGQQGSFLLWACCSAFFGLLAVRSTGIFRRWFTIPYAGFLAVLGSILAYESPFGLNRLDGVPYIPTQGVGLTPALQNYWVTIHPPTIFMGFGSLTVLAAYAFAALVTNKPKDWAPMVRPWALVSLALVGIGLSMGGFWAYETLGWGGFWAWDPVENVSFVPWLFTAAFVHGLMVQITKRNWTISTLLMGGLPFIMFVYGTFLTRSGVLNETSVHSFANMNHSALQLLLGFFGVSTITFLSLWSWRALQYRKSFPPDPTPVKGLNRESLFRLGAWLLIGIGAGAAIGMSWPMVMALSGQKPKVVEEGLYHHTLSWLYIPLMISMAIGPMIAWRGMGMREFSKRIYGVLCVTMAGVGVIMMIAGRSPWVRSLGPDEIVKLPFGAKAGIMPWVIFLVSLSVFVAVANIWRISELIRRSKMSAASFLAHVGVAVLMSGLIISRGFEQKAQIQVKEGKHAIGLGYLVSYDKMTSDPLDRNNKVLFTVQNVENPKDKFIASPGLYYVDGGDAQRQAMVWPHIESRPFSDIYMALQPPSNEIGVETELKLGQTTMLNGVPVTYEKLVQEGDPGKKGTKWGALLKFGTGADAIEVTPKMMIDPQTGALDLPAPINEDVLVSMRSMRAGENSVKVQLLSSKDIYPIDMFFKPMTILVWLGTGILGFAGFLSAWYRRYRPSAKPATATEDVAPQVQEKAKAKEKVAALRA